MHQMVFFFQHFLMHHFIAEKKYAICLRSKSLKFNLYMLSQTQRILLKNQTLSDICNSLCFAIKVSIYHLSVWVTGNNKPEKHNIFKYAFAVANSI